MSWFTNYIVNVLKIVLPLFADQVDKINLDNHSWINLINLIPSLDISQDYNADRVAERKRGIKLEISTLTQTQLEDAIQELLEDNM